MLKEANPTWGCQRISDMLLRGPALPASPSAVAHACQEFMAAESVILDYLKAGKVDPKGYAAARKGCKERIDALARKLKR